MPPAAKPEPVDDSTLAAAMPEVFKRLGLPAEVEAEFTADVTAPEPKPLTEAEKLAQSQEQERLETLALESGKTVDEIKAEEAAAAQTDDGEQKTEDGTEKTEGEEEKTETPTPEQQLTEATAQLTAKDAEIAELKAQLQTVTAKPISVTAQTLHPILTADNATDIEKTDAQLAQFEQWALKNWDGSEEVEAKGDQPAIPAFTKEQIRERYAQVKEQRTKLIPAARQALSLRQQCENEAKAAYPELFDPKKQESQFARQILAQAPGLKAIFPNIYMVIGDAIRGEKARLAAAQTGKPKPATAARPGAKPPTRATPGAGKPVTAGKPQPTTGNFSVKTFVDGGGSRDALVATIMQGL